MAVAMRGSAGLIALGAAAGLALSIFAYVERSSGINGTAGAMLVVASSAAILLAALALASWPGMWRGLRGLLLFLLLLGILGTGLAAYFLMSIWLLVAMAVCLIGWLLAISRGEAVQKAQSKSARAKPAAKARAAKGKA